MSFAFSGPASTRVSRGLSFLLVVALAASSGASCPQLLRGYQIGTLPLPRALPPQPTLDQVIAAVHDNTARVRSLTSTRAVLVAPGVPRLSAKIACEPPRRFRLHGQTEISGHELDIGSNDDLFWLWIRRHEPRTLAFCRHDRYAGSQARQLLPIRAEWMPELLGLVNFRTEDKHDGPYALPDGRIEVRSHLANDGEELHKSTILDGTSGLVAEQHLFTLGGERIASVRTTKYRVDPASGAALPHLIEISWPTSNIDFKLELSAITVNGPIADPAALWEMPTYPGYQPVDLAEQNPSLP